MVDLFEAYLLYQKYWISRKFVDIFGFNILTNNMRIINKFFGYKDLGKLKQICWYIVDKSVSSATDEEVAEFNKKIEESPYKGIIKYHLFLSVDGLRQRREHFFVCFDTIKALKEKLSSDVDDNIYNLNESYKENFFEEVLIKGSPLQPAIYSEFVKIVKENVKDTFTQENMLFDFIEEQCSC